MDEEQLKAIEAQIANAAVRVFDVAPGTYIETTVRLIAEVRRLRAAFEEYGDHKLNCPAFEGTGLEKCTCGYSQVWR